MFVDASAITAILLSEPDADELAAKLDASADRFTSAIALFETVRAVMRAKATTAGQARNLVGRFVGEMEIRLVSIGALESEAALGAMDRFGKGRHPARLNLDDCFAYACARTHGAPLLFKGDDFGKTDITAA
jgi:ribonuclease VapC